MAPVGAKAGQREHSDAPSICERATEGAELPGPAFQDLGTDIIAR